MVEKTIGVYLLLSSMYKSGMAFIGAIYAMFLLSRGLDFLEMNLVNLVFFATLLVFEIPTGAIADVFGRKLSFIAACTMESICMFTYSRSYTFSGFAASEGIGAVGSTLANGAFQSWLADELKIHNYSKPLVSVFNREQQISTACTIFAGMMGARVAKVDISTPWIVGCCLQLITICLAIVLMRETRTKNIVEKGQNAIQSAIESFGKVCYSIRIGICKGMKSDQVRFILLMETALFLCVQSPNMQWQPFFAKQMTDDSYLGYIYAGITISVIIGSFTNSWLLRITRTEKKAITAAQLIAAFGIVLTVLAKNFYVSLLLFFLHEVGRGMLRPLRDAYLNNNIDSDTRATVLSLASISHHIGGITGLLLSGLLAREGMLERAWIFSGITLAIATIIIMATTKKE